MGLRKRAGGVWHYRFKVGGVAYSGSTGCTHRGDAQWFERKVKRDIVQAATISQALDARRRMLRPAERVGLGDGYCAYLRRPGVMGPGTHRQLQEAGEWRRFAAWAQERGARFVDEITPELAGDYVAGLEARLSPGTRNDYVATLRRVFRELLGRDADPLRDVRQVRARRHAREAFSEAELAIMAREATGWIRHLLIVGVCTGMREGDICTLEWAEVDTAAGWIRRRTRKRGTWVEVPILPALAAHLATLERTGQYVHPELAARYGRGSGSHIGNDFTAWLRGLGIQTHRPRPRGVLPIQVKDVHSLRHTFVYLAALSGVPMPVVQSIVGHMSPEMTRRYSDHATAAAKREHLARLGPMLLGAGQENGQAERDTLKRLADSAPLDAVKRALRELGG